MEMTGLARLYARAVIEHRKLYAKDVSWMQRLDQLARFLDEQRGLLWYVQEDTYQTLLQVFELDFADFAALLRLLIREHRLFLLSSVVAEMAKLYRQHHGYEVCTVYSSQPLTEEQRILLMQQLEKKTGKKLYYVQEIDPHLIAGVRVQGESFIWEHSVAQQMRSLKQHLMARL